MFWGTFVCLSVSLSVCIITPKVMKKIFLIFNVGTAKGRRHNILGKIRAYFDDSTFSEMLPGRGWYFTSTF